MKIINLNQHSINILDENGNINMIFPCSDMVARCTESRKKVGEINGVPITETVYGEVVDMPQPKEGVIYLTNYTVRRKYPERDDLYYPNEVIRQEGKIIGCKSLTHVF